MKYIIIPSTDHRRQLPFFFAVEEFVARQFTDDDYFFIWQVPPTAMLGRNQLADNEVNKDYCKQNDIRIFRRKSGGGCVYADEGCLQFSFIVSDSDTASTFQRYMQTVADVLRNVGIEATLSGRNDILVGGKKVAGAAFYRIPGRSVMHNTLLFSTNLENLSLAVTPPTAKLDSKGVQSVSQRVGNVGEHTSLSIPQFIASARQFLCGDECRMLTADDMKQIEKMEKELASDDFTYGKNPAYTVVRKKNIPNVGYVEAYVEIKNDIIRNINLMGDYFLLGDIDKELLHRLRGVRFHRDTVAYALSGVELQSVIRNMTVSALQRLLFGRREHVRKPEWLKISIASKHHYSETEHIINRHGLNTICTSGLCPNRSECWAAGTATLMIGGNICTRSCRFCNTPSGRPLPLDPEEPQKVAQTVRQMNLRYAVITSVDRDDLPDYGAYHWQQTIMAIRKMNPETGIEVLIPDFQGQAECINAVLEANPDVVGHNMETIRRLTPRVRSVAKYEQSLSVLRQISERGFHAKTGFMVGLGETEAEVAELMNDIRSTGCISLTIGQYLQPTAHHLPVAEYIHPKQFDRYADMAREMGFENVVSGPLVRSSYHAEMVMNKKNNKM